MMTTTAEQLQQVNNAIAAIEIGGQEYQIGNRKLRRADLSLLYARQKELQAQLSYESSSSSLLNSAYVAEFDRR